MKDAHSAVGDVLLAWSVHDAREQGDDMANIWLCNLSIGCRAGQGSLVIERMILVTVIERMSLDAAVSM